MCDGVAAGRSRSRGPAKDATLAEAQATGRGATMFIALVAGMILGFVGSIPIAGPISALVLERTLAGQPNFARGVSVGAALAEAGYATLAFVGIGEFISRFPGIALGTKLFGVVVLIVVAVLLLRGSDAIPVATTAGGARDDGNDAQQGQRARLRGVGVGFTIAIMNPALIATWSTTTATLFATGYVHLDAPSTVGFAVGTCLGIAGWLVILVGIVSRNAERLAPTALRLARRGGAGFALAVSAVLAVQAARPW